MLASEYQVCPRILCRYYIDLYKVSFLLGIKYWKREHFFKHKRYPTQGESSYSSPVVKVNVVKQDGPFVSVVSI